MCRLVWDRHAAEGLPYAIRYHSGRFDPTTAELLLDNNAVGLTCATFILVVYASCGIQLILSKSWPPREDDMKWHDSIVDALEKHSTAPAQHIETLRLEKGCARFRPEEVSAACLLEESPGSFEHVVKASHKVLEELAAIQLASP